MGYAKWLELRPPRPVGAGTYRCRLDAGPDAPAVARAALGDLRDGLRPAVLERGTLLVSELVTNSFLHTIGAGIELELSVHEGALDVVVRDCGDGFFPAPLERADRALGGWGLQLLDELADAWTSGGEGGAWVWFRLEPRT